MERISCHADLRAMQDRSNRRMFLKLVSLESVSIASDSYALLRNLVERRNWRCSEMDMDFLSLVASVAVELHKIKLALSPLLDQQAKPGEVFPKDLLLLKNTTVALLGLWEDANEIDKKCVGSLVEQNVFLGNAENVGAVVEDSVNQVLKGDKADGVLDARRQGRRCGVVGRQRGGRPRGVGRCPSPSPCPLAPLARASSIPHRLRLPNPCANDRRSAVARCCRRQPRVRSLRHQAKSYRTGTVRHGGRPLPVRDTSIASSPRPSSNHNIRSSHLCSRGCRSGFDVLLLKK